MRRFSGTVTLIDKMGQLATIPVSLSIKETKTHAYSWSNKEHHMKEYYDHEKQVAYVKDPSSTDINQIQALVASFYQGHNQVGPPPIWKDVSFG